MNCLICHEEIMPELGWTYLFSKETPQYLCDLCQSRFIKIDGETCRICDRPLENIQPQFKIGDLCLDCVRWEEDEEWAGCLEKNHSAVIYNDFAQELIAQFKYRGDYVLANAIASQIRGKLAAITFDLIVPIPLSKERLYDRGFNQSEALIKACGHKPAQLLTRTHTEKQSKKSRSERIHLAQVFQLRESVSSRKVLLIDDIYTTGSTLRHAAKLLKDSGAKSISSLTFAR